MSEGKEAYYRERAILAIERGDYEKATQYTKRAEKAKETKRPTDKYEIGTVVRFAQTWVPDRDFYLVAIKINIASWLLYGRNSYELRNEVLTWDTMLCRYWDDSHTVHVFNEANGKVLK